MIHNHILLYVYSGVLVLEEGANQTIVNKGECTFLRRDNRMSMTKQPVVEEQFQAIFMIFKRNKLCDFYQKLDKKKLPPETEKPNVDFVTFMAAQKQATPATIALAWILVQKPWIVPIPGTTKLDRLIENIGSVSIELTSDELKKIEEEATKITIQGERYQAAAQKMINR